MNMLFSAVLCLTFTVSAYAQDVRSLAVLPAENISLDESTVGIFNELFIAQLGSMKERRIITMRDIEAMLGFEQTKQAFDCSEASCLAEIGGSLGVDELLYPRVTGVGDELMLSFTLLDVAKAQVIARSSLTIENEPNAYRQAARGALVQLWEAAGMQSVSKEPEGPQSKVTLEVASDASMAAPSTLSWVIMGSGLVLLGGGTYLGLDAQTKYELAKSRVEGSQAAIDSGKRSVLYANIFIAAGALATSVGVSLWLFSDEGGPQIVDAEPKTLSLAPLVGRDAAGVLLQGSF